MTDKGCSRLTALGCAAVALVFFVLLTIVVLVR